MVAPALPVEMNAREAQLVRRLQDRDEDAFCEMVGTYQNKVFNLVYRMLGNREEAKDVAQDVFITVFKSIDSFRGESKFSTWLYRIAVNHCKNRLKYLGRRSWGETGEFDEAAERELQGATPTATTPHIDGPEKVLEGLQLQHLVQEAIGQLDAEHRELLVLREVEDMPYDEIAQATGLPEGTVKSRLHRARQAIKDFLARHMR